MFQRLLLKLVGDVIFSDVICQFCMRRNGSVVFYCATLKMESVILVRRVPGYVPSYQQRSSEICYLLLTGTFFSECQGHCNFGQQW